MPEVIVKKKKNKQAAKQAEQPKQEPKKAKVRENFSLDLDGQKVMVALDYKGDVLSLTGVLHCSKYELKLELDNGDTLIINKAYVIFVKPVVQEFTHKLYPPLSPCVPALHRSH